MTGHDRNAIDTSLVRIASINANGLGHSAVGSSSSLHHISKLYELSSYFHKNNILLACVQETIVPDTASIEPIHGNYHYMFSPARRNNDGRADGGHHHGMAIAIHKDYHSRILHIEHVSPELQWCIIDCDDQRIRLMNIYAPHSGLSQVKFTEYLQLVTQHLHIMEQKYPNGITIMPGDYNAEFGRGRETNSDRHNPTRINWSNNVLGTQLPIRRPNSYQLPTRNGSDVLDFCNQHSLIIANSFSCDDTAFNHQQQLLGTWTRCARDNDHNPIQQTALDHILVSHQHQDIITQCGVLPATANLDISDHRIIFIEISMDITNTKTSNKGRTPAPPKFDFKKIREDTKLQRTLQDKLLHTLTNSWHRNPNDDPSSQLTDFSSIVHDFLLEEMPRKQQLFRKSYTRGHEPQLLRLIQQKYDANVLDQQQPSLHHKLKYRQAKSKLKQFTRRIMASSVRQYSQQLNNAYHKRDMKTYYQLLQQVYSKKSPSPTPLMTTDTATNTIAIDEEESARSWFEYCEQLFNEGENCLESAKHEMARYQQFVPNAEAIRELERDIDTDDITEVLAAIQNDKAVSIHDKIPAEVYKYLASFEVKHMIAEIFTEIYRSANVPKSFKDVVIRMIHKKGSRRLHKNYRGISIVSHLSKIFERIINKRLSIFVALVPRAISSTAFGFVPERGTDDAIFCSRMLTHLALDADLVLYKIFVDLRKAYDRVHRDTLWEILRMHGVPSKLINLLTAMLDGASATVIINGKETPSFDLTRGLKQGSVLSPLLFNIFFSMILRITQDKAVEERQRIHATEDQHGSSYMLWSLRRASDTEDYPTAISMATTLQNASTAYVQVFPSHHPHIAHFSILSLLPHYM